MAATPQNVEMEAAKFLHKLIQESTDEPTKLATKLHVILQHMRSSGKENSMPYQVISRAMETVINRHGLDIDALMSSRQPLTGGTQAGDSSLTQIAGPQQTAMESDSKKTLTTEDTTKIAAFSGKPLHGSSSAGHDIYQGSANQLNPIKSHGANAGVSGSYESTEPGNLMNMQFSNSYDNQSATTLMHKDRRTETFSTPTLSDLTSGKGPAGKALEHEGGFPNVMGNVSKTVQGGISSNITEMAILRNEAPRDTGKSPVVLQAPSAGPSTPFKEHHLKQLRAQCLVFLAFRNNLMPKKLHLDIALGNFFPKEDISGKEHIDQKGKEQSIGGQSVSHEVAMPSARKTERIGSGLSNTSFISEPNLLKEGEKLDGTVDKNDPPSGLPEHGEALRNNMIPRKFEAEMHAFETKESQMSATKVAQPDNFSSQSKSHADSQGNRHGHGNLPSFPLRESWKSHPGMEGNNHEGEDISEPSPSPPSPRYTTSEKWIADFQKRKVAAEHNWAVKKKKMEQRISACAAKLKETVSSSEDISAKTRSVIELKKLELLDLQRRLRNDILHDFFKPISTEMDRLKSIKKNRVGRRSKQLEKYEQKMKEERQKRIRERQKDFFSEMELHKERLEDVFKFRRERAKGFNKYVREFHKRKERLHREKIDRIQREKINLLKINDVEGYLRMVQDAKSDRVKQLLKETEKYLQKLGSKLKEAKVISRCFDTDTGVSENSEFIIENEDETDQAKHYMESNEKYYMMAHSIKEIVTEQPLSLVGGKLREYQLNGLRWLLSLYNNHLNGILADEMGLGKTVQVISLLCYLMENKNDRGPFLVVVPSSVLPGWETEINFWAPSINKIVYAGPPEERRRLLKERIVQQKFNVLLTTYEYLMNKHDRPKLSKIHWHYVIIDEGHRIKNASCKLNAELKHYHSSHRLLLTGTPLQNNLEELWALLNFLLPNIFNSSEDFSQWFNKPFESNADNSVEEALLSEEENLLIINRLHQVLRPFVLRRLKHKVENQLPEKIERLVRCEASAYQKLLMRRVEDSLGAFGSSKSRAVHNSVVELRNICNHPYLSQLHTEEVHDFLPKHYLPNVIRFCGKLEMLDRLLPKLKATDHRVLLFSTMTRLLDVMEDYLYWKQYKYLRLDGHTCGGDRGALIDQFNKPGSPFFIFLLSIRAGGVGVNLQAADTVIIFDTDWNPQVDLQAQARAHRIGQKKDVLVLRLETVKTVEEQVRASAEHKLGVANQSITAGFFDNNTSAEDRREYLESLLRECKKEEAAPVLNDDALNDLIARSESEIDVFEELDKKRQEDELVVWKNLVSEQEGLSAELIPPLPSRLVTDDELKSFCEAMKAIEVPKPVVMPGIAGKRRSELGNFDTQQYGRGKRAREVRSYEEQWTEDEFEKLCQVEAPDSPKPNEELKEKDLATVTSESGMVTGAESAGLPNIQQFRPSEEFASQQIKEINPPSKRGRGRPKKKPTYISSSPIGLPAPSVPVPSAARNVMGTVYPLGIQTAPGTQLITTGPSGSKSIPTDGGQLTVDSASASNATLAVPPGFQATANSPLSFRPTTTSPPGYRPITTPPPGYQPKTTPPGYQQIAPAPPGFQPKIASPAPLPASQASTSHISAPLSTPTPASVSQSTPTLPAGSQSTTAIKCESLVNPSLPSVSQSNTALHSSSVPNSNLPPSTQFPTLPDVSVSLTVPSTSSTDSQSPISPVVTPGRGRGRGRGRPRGRGRGRGQIIESEVGVPQRRGKKGNNVVLGIPGHLMSSPISKPAIGSPVVPATSSETRPEPLVSGSTAVNAVSVTPPPGIVGTPVIVPPPGIPKSDITSPRLSDPTTPIVPTPVTPKSNILTGIGETVLHPDVGTTQMMPPSVSVVSQSTELGALSSHPPTPFVTVPLGTPSASVSSSASKQGRGRGRKAQSGSGAPRRMERKREDIVDDQEKKSNEPPKKKTRVSSGRKTVATRSMSRNEANKSPNDASTTDVDCSQGSKLAEQSQNASTNEKERSSTLVKTDVLTKFDDASKVDDDVNNHAEKVVERNDISVATEAGSKTHEAIEKTEPKEELSPKILTNLEGERESKSETLETRESKPSKEVKKSKKTEVFKAETKHEETDTECNALEDTGKEGKTEVGAENELSIQKKTEEKAQAINDGGTMEVMEANPAEETDVAVCGASEVVQGGGCVMVVDKENVVENAEDPIVTVHQCETERPGITGGDSPLETEAASSEKFEEIHQGGIENEEKEQEANDPTDMDDTGKTSTGLDVAQGEGDGLVSAEGGDLEEKGAISSNEAMDALQGEAECDKRPLEASGVSGDVGMKLSEDENTPDDPPVEKGEREDLDIDGGTHVMTEDNLSEKVEAISHEKVEDAFQEETEHEKPGGVDGIVENVIDDVNTSRELLVMPTVQGGREGVEKSDGGSLVDTDVKPFEEAENAPEGESGHEKQEIGRSDTSGGVKENVTEDGQTTMVLPVTLGEREDHGNTDGSTEGEVDAKSCEKTETENEDVVGGIEKDVDEDEESIKELPAAREEKEVSEKDNEELQGETVIEAKEKTDVAPLGQVEEREVSEKDNEELQGETVIEAKETTDVAPLGQEEERELSEKDNDELQGQAVIESKQKTDGASLGQDVRGNLDIMDTEKPIESVNESVQVENESKGEDIDVKSSSDKVDDNPLEGKTEEADKSSQEAEEASEGRKDETKEVNKSSQEAEQKAVEECGHDVIQVTIEEDVAYDAKHSSDKPAAAPPPITTAAEAHDDDDGDSSTKEPSGNVNNELVETEAKPSLVKQ